MNPDTATIRRLAAFVVSHIRNGTSYDDIKVDGDIGSRTLAAMDRLLTLGDESTLLKVLNLLQGAHYIDFMRRAPVQEKFARGWLNRVDISRS